MEIVWRMVLLDLELDLELEDSDEALGVVKADSHSFSKDATLSALGARVKARDMAPEDVLDRISCMLLLPEPHLVCVVFLVSFSFSFSFFFGEEQVLAGR